MVWDLDFVWPRKDWERENVHIARKEQKILEPEVKEYYKHPQDIEMKMKLYANLKNYVKEKKDYEETKYWELKLYGNWRGTVEQDWLVVSDLLPLWHPQWWILPPKKAISY